MQTSMCLGLGATIKPYIKLLFTDRSKVVLHLWIIFVIYVSCVSLFLSVHRSLVITCWERANLLALLRVLFYSVFVTFPCGVLGTWLSFVMFNCVLSLPMWVICGT